MEAIETEGPATERLSLGEVLKKRIGQLFMPFQNHPSVGWILWIRKHLKQKKDRQIVFASKTGQQRGFARKTAEKRNVL